ncbi:hypothetical protein RMSM_03795 [Rhodopirellula maiorica SM1]|uniref:Uncharacterized protein n=1 Tax=Rhodopirellula maiorica SM1 TaxID=1265738 RepID=M5RJE2_9BACT|nr:hypothetical protein [Rhodopirellula maiorica]EMI19291.1 hypothetical protein RMSM_03795 [Rhodopirellula maiorica SM1]
MNRFIHIRSNKFPILPGEQHELVNDGIYGKALAEYLQLKLADRDYVTPFVCCEDWGWWVEIKSAPNQAVPFKFGVCIYSAIPTEDEGEDQSPTDFACTEGTSGLRNWSWKKMRFIDTAPWTHQLHEELLEIFQADKDVEIIGTSEEFPL